MRAKTTILRRLDQRISVSSTLDEEHSRRSDTACEELGSWGETLFPNECALLIGL